MTVNEVRDVCLLETRVSRDAGSRYLSGGEALKNNFAQ
jgi:hypothetical protein